jgi:hypothetical protein
VWVYLPNLEQSLIIRKLNRLSDSLDNRGIPDVDEAIEVYWKLLEAVSKLEVIAQEWESGL